MIRDYVKTRLAAFVHDNTGKILDLTGAYGGQSPDLAAAWISYLSPKPVTPSWHAAELAEKGFPEWEWYAADGGDLPEPGDLLVWAGKGANPTVSPYGHAAIFLAADEDLFVFTQSPGPCSTGWISPVGLLGWHRYVGSNL